MHLRSFIALSCACACVLTLISAGGVVYAQTDDTSAPTSSVGPLVQEGEARVEAAAAKELLVFEVNRRVTTKDHGFPWDNPPQPAANSNWKTPVNFAAGTLYFRVQVRSQPRPQNMRMQFCIWQYQNKLENCGSLKNVSGAAGTVVTWSQSVQSLWKKNGKPIDWVHPRDRYGFAIKNAAGKPVSDYAKWNWNGENPSFWYPLDVRITVVAVAKGATFGGWGNYLGTASGELTTPDESSLEAGSDPSFGSGLESDLQPDGQEQHNLLYLPMVSGQ